jgi:hypothetical protein
MIKLLSTSKSSTQNEFVAIQQKQQAAVLLLQSWIDDGDAEEQQETAKFLTQALDQDRLSDRKLFPKELKGVSW